VYQPKFVWESGLWGPTPRWLSPPNIAVIERLSRTHLRLPDDCDLVATFFAEGAFNKLYTITVSERLSSQYIFRVTSPVEPFYKTASEVATLSYTREYTSVPVPRVIAYCSNAKNELGCEWILMERVPGVALGKVWGDIDFETKSKVTKQVAGFVKQLRGIQPPFVAIGNLYFRADIEALNAAAYVVPLEDEKYVLGPIVTTYMFAGGRKLRVPRNLGPYSNDAQYIAALAAVELGEVKLLQSAESRSHGDFDEDLAEISGDIAGLLDELHTISSSLFPSPLLRFTLYHHDLSLANILVDPPTYEVMGIVDWECVGTRSHWEDTYPLFLLGPEIEEEVEPLDPGDKDDARVEHWENWEKMKLRLVFDQQLTEVQYKGDGLRREFREQLDWLGVSPKKVKNWIRDALNTFIPQLKEYSGLLIGAPLLKEY